MKKILINAITDFLMIHSFKDLKLLFHRKDTHLSRKNTPLPSPLRAPQGRKLAVLRGIFSA
jgi:hypothetical protein